MARIIIVEDDDIIAEIASGALDAAGHMTSEVPDGARAVEAIRIGRPDLVILDYNLPGETGMEILRQVRRMDADNSIRVMFLTASGSRLLQARAEQAGADDYLVKPFTPDELVRRVEALLHAAPPQAGVTNLIERR
jgi:DNA-binding response OmpR family regulator